MSEDGSINRFPKKEILGLQREREKLGKEPRRHQEDEPASRGALRGGHSA